MASTTDTPSIARPQAGSTEAARVSGGPVAHRARRLKSFLATEAGTPWLAGAVLIAAGVLAPLATLLWYASQGSFDHWRHLLDHVLPLAFLNTSLLLAGVAVLVTALGVGAAWLITAYRFPGRSILSWALLLPLAVPTYIVAFAYLDILHPIGPVQSFIREMLGYSSPREFRLPDLRSLPGAIVLLGFVLYPYVYLSTRIMFATQAASLLEAARILGESGRGVFLRVALPMARPAIAVGVSLALLEALNDIGASEFLGVQTLTVSVYTTWVTRNDLAGAAQIALAMLAMVALLVMLERRGRKRQRYASNLRARPVQPRQLHGLHAAGAAALGWAPVVIGFVAPALYLCSETIKHLTLAGSVSDQLLASAFNTLKVALLATFFTLLCGLVAAWASRSVRHSDRPTLARACARIATSGYAIPGTVLAIGLLTPLIAFDGLLSTIWSRMTGADPGLWLMGSVGALVCGYVIRFLAISVGGMESGLARIPPSLEQAARLLGETPAGTLRRIHLPLLRPAIGAAGLLVFVDAMKELPATLLLRPAGFETLATWLYAEAARGTYEEGAVAALAIVLAGLLPVVLLARTQLKPAY